MGKWLKKLKRFLISRFILNVNFIKKKNSIYFTEVRTIYKISIATDQGITVKFNFKKDKRRTLFLYRSFIVDAEIEAPVNDDLREIVDHILISVICVRFPFSHKTLCLYLLDCYLDEALKLYRKRSS